MAGGVRHPLDDFGLEVLPGLDQILDALLRLVGARRQILRVARLARAARGPVPAASSTSLNCSSLGRMTLLFVAGCIVLPRLAWR
jgi:hypothetical protein